MSRRQRTPSVRHAAAAGLAALLLGLVSPALASAARPRASFIGVENAVMCVLCHEPLAVANSPEAYQERQYIHAEIAQGKTQKQIEHDLVQQLGPSVLALPPAHGFNVLVYVVPPVLVILGLGVLSVTIPRWRRRSRRAGDGSSAMASALSDEDASRLDAELAEQP